MIYSQLFYAFLCQRIKQLSHILVDYSFFLFEIIYISYTTCCQRNFKSSIICYFFNLTYCLDDLVALSIMVKLLVKFNKLILIYLLFFFLSRYSTIASISNSYFINFRNLLFSKGASCLLYLINRCLKEL